MSWWRHNSCWPRKALDRVYKPHTRSHRACYDCFILPYSISKIYCSIFIPLSGPSHLHKSKYFIPFWRSNTFTAIPTTCMCTFFYEKLKEMCYTKPFMKSQTPVRSVLRISWNKTYKIVRLFLLTGHREWCLGRGVHLWACCKQTCWCKSPDSNSSPTDRTYSTGRISIIFIIEFQMRSLILRY